MTCICLHFYIQVSSGGSSSSGYSWLNYNSVVSCGPSPQIKRSYEKGEIHLNDNRRAAGEFKHGAYHIDLEAKEGLWYPELHDGPGIKVQAFAERGKDLQIPGPLIRLPENTQIVATVQNLIKNTKLVLKGFHGRPGSDKDSVIIQYNEKKKIVFNSGAMGTYSYWATTGNLRLGRRPFHEDSQLYGGFIIDKKNELPDPAERIFMIGIWDDTLNGNINFFREEVVMNGAPWPFSEMLEYSVKDSVHWRIINASSQSHPMHLHGFFYDVLSKGTGETDNIYKPGRQRKVVTELLLPGETMAVSWIPEKEGNWLFHCHTIFHISPELSLRPKKEHTKTDDHPMQGMGGLVMGIRILSKNPDKQPVFPTRSDARKITLTAVEKLRYYDSLPGMGFILSDPAKKTLNTEITIPGPPIILEQDKMVDIKVVNRLTVPTSIHWHGMEIESYFDGVAGWGITGGQISPMLEPGDSFVVQMTPPRPGTFIYHTHMHDAQLFSGMYGPLIVLKPGEVFDSSKDKIFLLGGSDPHKYAVVLNGSKNPPPMELIRDKKYRFRIINITPFNPLIQVSLSRNNIPQYWKSIAQDGADFPEQQKEIIKADQSISIGQTMDFEYTPSEAGIYEFKVVEEDRTWLKMNINVREKY